MAVNPILETNVPGAAPPLYWEGGDMRPATEPCLQVLNDACRAALSGPPRKPLATGDAGRHLAELIEKLAPHLARLAKCNGRFTRLLMAAAQGAEDVSVNGPDPLGLVVAIKGSVAAATAVALHLDECLVATETECDQAAAPAPTTTAAHHRFASSKLDQALSVLHALAILLKDGKLLDRMCAASSFGELLLPRLSNLCDALDLFSASVMDHTAVLDFWPGGNGGPGRKRAAADIRAGIGVVRAKLRDVAELFTELFVAAQVNAERRDAVFPMLARNGTVVRRNVETDAFEVFAGSLPQAS